MSLFGALNSSVTGVRAQSDALGIISDNIGNVNTTGFKANEANFASLVTGSGTPTSFNPGGVQIRPTLEAGQQGVLDSSEIATDLAIDGNGFFSVKSSVGNVGANELLFSRAGNFRVNDNGNLENASGFLLQGWRLSEDGNGDLVPPPDQQNPGSLETVNVTGFSGIARATQNLEIGANIPPNLPVDESREMTVRIFDSEGTAHNVRLEFTRNDGAGNELPANQFRMDINAPTLANDPDAPQSGLFTPPGGGAVDTTATAVQSATQFINQQIDAAAAAPPNDPLEFTTSAGTFQVQDTTGTGIVAPDAATAQANVQAARNGPGLQIVGNGQTIEVDDANLNNLILATNNITNANGSFDGNSAEFNLLGSGPRIRISREEGGGPLDTSGDDIFQQGELDTADIIQVDQNNDNNFDGGRDLTLNKADNTVDDTAFQEVSRLSTVVEFKDGGIRQIGQGGTNGNLAANSFSDAAAITSDANGELQLGVMFNQNGAAPGGTDADQPQNLNLNVGTPLDPDGVLPEENDRLTDGLTSFESGDGFSVRGIEQDGLQFGNFTGVVVGEDGIVTATFSNGERRDIFQLPVATFNNPNGLTAQSGTVFQQSPDSGELLLNEAGIGAAGTIAPAALEQSTVDLATEFTKMIETQRAFSSATRVITTSDEMLQSIINVSR